MLIEVNVAACKGGGNCDSPSESARAASVGLLPADVLAAMFADFCPFFNDFSTIRAFPGKVSCVYFGDGGIDLLLDQIVAESCVP